MRAPRFLLSILFLLLSSFALAQDAAPSAQDQSIRRNQRQDAILLTVFLKHDQGMNIEEIKTIQEKQDFFKNFPPPGTAVVGWYVMMGIGQVVILEVPADKLREVNLAIEKSAWKAFRSEFYPTYNLYPVIRQKLKNKARLEL